MFDLQIDKKKKKKKKKMSSMNKSCEQKQQQHIVKIFYMWMFCKYKTVCAELAVTKSPSTEWS